MICLLGLAGRKPALACDDYVGKDPKSQFLCVVPKTPIRGPSCNLRLHSSALTKIKSYLQKQL